MLARQSDILIIIAGLLLAGITLVLGFTYAPSVDTDAMNAPHAQRIFYWHVPAAWASFIAFSCLFVGSLAWFWKRADWGWNLHCAGAEVGLLFGLMVITSGPIWGQAEWDRPWDWFDIRLNSFLALTALAAFVVLGKRTQPDGEATRDTFSAVGLFGFLLVPLTAMATTLWQRTHPGVITVGSGGGLDPVMAQVFWLGVLSFTVLAIGMIRLHIGIVKLEYQVDVIQINRDAEMI